MHKARLKLVRLFCVHLVLYCSASCPFGENTYQEGVKYCSLVIWRMWLVITSCTFKGPVSRHQDDLLSNMKYYPCNYVKISVQSCLIKNISVRVNVGKQIFFFQFDNNLPEVNDVSQKNSDIGLKLLSKRCHLKSHCLICSCVLIQEGHRSSTSLEREG